MVLEGSQDFFWRETGSATLETKYVVCLFVVLFFCIVDGAMTLFLVARGAWDANPLMRYALSVSDEFFIIFKYFLTAGGLLFLLRNGRMRVFKGRLSLEEMSVGLVLVYEVLIIYELTVFHVIQ